MERARYRIVIIQWPLSRKNWRKIKVVKRGRCKKKKKRTEIFIVGNVASRRLSSLLSLLSIIGKIGLNYPVFVLTAN